MPRSRSHQLELFAPTGAPASSDPQPSSSAPERAPCNDALEARFAALREVASRIAPHVRFGTSSWSFPGWQGIVYPPGQTERSLARNGLHLYVRHPLLRTVGIDRGYYAPIPVSDLTRYAAQLPAGFPCCSKVPESYTTPVVLAHRHQARGSHNPRFLDPIRFCDEVAGPYLAAFRDHAGPMILAFPPLPREHRLSAVGFLDRLDAFLGAVPPELSYAVELRDPTLLTPEYAQLLASHHASHVYNYWTGMPMPGAQAAIVPSQQGPCALVRLLLRPGSRYDDRKRAFAPFDRIVDPDEQMREQVLAIVRAAALAGRPAYVLVNNKAEGSAPLTIEELARGLVGEDGPTDFAGQASGLSRP